jgi:hypothetical protein
MKKTLLFLLLAGCSTFSFAEFDHCKEIGGETISLKTKYSGDIPGFSHLVCQLHIDHGIAQIGLKTLQSKRGNIAATLVQTLKPLDEKSTLFKGPYNNPSMNVCKNLGGSMTPFIAHGNTTGELGETDICMFGDGSFISTWTLIYIANGREGYHVIKDRIQSEPVPLMY